jgi:NodT family efflux transporter outer membrane factor (OMF) lipoprotein
MATRLGARRRIGAGSLLAALSLVAASCDLAPAYHVPASVKVSPVYKGGGLWTPSLPQDTAPRGRWWTVFRDPVLNALEERLDTGSAQIAVYLARYDEARGAARTARSNLYPQLALNGEGTRGKSLLYGDEHDYQGSLGLSYEVDLWGQVRNQVAAARHDVEAARADLAFARLSSETLLAESYMNLRGEDARIDLLRQTSVAYERALALTQTLYNGGAASEVDLDRARTQLFDARAQLDQAAAARAEYENAIADLIGDDPSSFRLAPETVSALPPRIPVGAPSTLLQRRPDIAAAERRVAAANARIGVARAALYPSLTLDLSGGYTGIIGTLVNVSGLVWALGPEAVSAPLFDAGNREGIVQERIGELREAAADYRQTVLDAFRDVEDQMALANHLAAAADNETQAVLAADRALALATDEYKDGAVDYLQVVVAQTADLAARDTVIGLDTSRRLAAVDLIRALGGGW